MEELTFTPTSSNVFGIPIEKLCTRNNTVEYLFQRNNFTPIQANNQVYTQGYFNEITAFVNAVERNCGNVFTKLGTTKSVYETIKEISLFTFHTSLRQPFP